MRRLRGGLQEKKANGDKGRKRTLTPQVKISAMGKVKSSTVFGARKEAPLTAEL